MDKILEYTERILKCCVSDLTTESCDIQRTVVSKILKELVEEKFTSTNKAMVPCRHCMPGTYCNQGFGGVCPVPQCKLAQHHS